MINEIVGVIGSLYYVSQAEKLSKPIEVDRSYNKCEAERIAKVQKVSRLNALNEREKNTKPPQEYFKTEVVIDKNTGQKMICTMTRYGYRQVNLVNLDEKVNESS